jgi:hypothetical protein
MLGDNMEVFSGAVNKGLSFSGSLTLFESSRVLMRSVSSINPVSMDWNSLLDGYRHWLEEAAAVVAEPCPNSIDLGKSVGGVEVREGLIMSWID